MESEEDERSDSRYKQVRRCKQGRLERGRNEG